MFFSVIDNIQEIKVLGFLVRDRDLSLFRKVVLFFVKVKKFLGKQQDKGRELVKKEKVRVEDEYEDDFEEIQEFVSSFEDDSKFVFLKM